MQMLRVRRYHPKGPESKEATPILQERLQGQCTRANALLTLASLPNSVCAVFAKLACRVLCKLCKLRQEEPTLVVRARLARSHHNPTPPTNICQRVAL